MSGIRFIVFKDSSDENKTKVKYENGKVKELIKLNKKDLIYIIEEILTISNQL